jgi:hypothetical protein
MARNSGFQISTVAPSSGGSTAAPAAGGEPQRKPASVGPYGAPLLKTDEGYSDAANTLIERLNEFQAANGGSNLIELKPTRQLIEKILILEVQSLGDPDALNTIVKHCEKQNGVGFYQGRTLLPRAVACLDKEVTNMLKTLVGPQPSTEASKD